MRGYFKSSKGGKQRITSGVNQIVKVTLRSFENYEIRVTTSIEDYEIDIIKWRVTTTKQPSTLMVDN